MPSPKDTSLALVRDYGKTLLFAVLIALSIRFFVVEAYRIPSSAMRPALEPGDTIFVAKWPFGIRFPGYDTALTRSRTPAHGEVVVFALQQDDVTRDYIKRVVGLPGDTVEVKAGKLILNGQSMEVPGSEHANCASERTPGGLTYPVCFETPALEDFGPEKVPDGSVFLLGDLRKKTPRELGSDLPVKSWGIHPVSSLRGSALWIWLSVDPSSRGGTTGLFPNLRFDRMFRRIQ